LVCVHCGCVCNAASSCYQDQLGFDPLSYGVSGNLRWFNTVSEILKNSYFARISRIRPDKILRFVEKGINILCILTRQLTLVWGVNSSNFRERSVVNFTNFFWTAFMGEDPKSAKIYWWLDCLFYLLGSAHVKAFRKTLVKLTPDDWKSRHVGGTSSGVRFLVGALVL